MAQQARQPVDIGWCRHHAVLLEAPQYHPQVERHPGWVDDGYDIVFRVNPRADDDRIGYCLFCVIIEPDHGMIVRDPVLRLSSLVRVRDAVRAAAALLPHSMVADDLAD